MTQQNEAAIKSITAAMDTETGRKILTHKMISLTKDNRTLRRKVAEDRIAVHALNTLSVMLVRILDAQVLDNQENGVALSEDVLKRIKAMNAYRLENFGHEMIDRIDSILGDTEGDDLLLADLIGKQPEEGK
jgi:hypothetical protein